MSFFGMDPQKKNYAAKQSQQGLLVLNHEYLQQSQLHTPGGTITVDGKRPEDQILREVNAHGVSVVEIQKDANTQAVKINLNSPFNRRITAATEMELRGPARGSDLMKTRFSPAGTLTRGTFANCGNGYTPWGTYLTAEENWSGYFSRDEGDVRTDAEQVALSRYGRGGPATSQYRWDKTDAELTGERDLYDRWNITAQADGSALTDYRNAMNTYIVVHARLAADYIQATKMDRPEWVAVNPENGEVYVTLTNNSLDDLNDFSSPDGMWFDPRGILWIQTDDGQYTDETNCMMLAALPGKVGDGTKALAASTKA
ncbi:unnamed protein product, partial [Cylicostephanus goldi]